MGITQAGTFSIGGREVVRLGYGAMRLCGAGVWGAHADPERSRRVLRRAVELGVTLIDTADAYGPEVNEYEIAAALRPYRGLLIATKGGLVREGPGVWTADGRPEHLRRAIANSLRRLGVEAIDLYQLHVPDSRVPFLDSVGELARAQEQGLIREIGLSNVSVEQLDAALGVVRVATVQNRYNLQQRVHQPVLDRCAERGIGFLPFFPLAAGPLSEAGGVVERIAQRHGASQAQVALAWLLAKSPVMLPIPGTSSVAHLEENCGAAAVVLEPAEFAELDALG